MSVDPTPSVPAPTATPTAAPIGPRKPAARRPKALWIAMLLGFGALIPGVGIIGFILWDRQAVRAERAPALRDVEGMVHRRELLGLTREELIARLGPPAPEGPFADYDLRYPIGPSSSFGSRRDWLLIELAEGRVSMVTIGRE